MNARSTAIPGVLVVDTKSHVDHRGSFTRLFCEQELGQILVGRRVVQINQSRTVAVGAVRGLHYQNPPHAEVKLVRCWKGKIWDVAVDLRRDSPTFLQWHAEELSGRNARMVVIPEGIAHGFQVLEPDSELLYLHTEFYNSALEGGVHPQDPRLNIPWPLTVIDLSVRDREHPLLTATFSGLNL